MHKALKIDTVTADKWLFSRGNFEGEYSDRGPAFHEINSMDELNRLIFAQLRAEKNGGIR